MWLPPAYRRPRPAIYWRVFATLALLLALGVSAAAVAQSNWFSLVFAGLFGLIALWCWGALHAQHPRDHKRGDVK